MWGGCDEEEEEGEVITLKMALVIAAASVSGFGSWMFWSLAYACMAAWCGLGVGICCNVGLTTSLRVSGKWVVFGMLNRRDEYSGLSMDNDEDDEGGFGSGSLSGENCLEKSSGNQLLNSFSMSIYKKIQLN